MKNIIWILILILTISCDHTKKEKSQEVTVSDQQTPVSNSFDWLVGEWKRLHEEAGKETFENWEKVSDGKYAGHGFTLQDRDTLKQEKMKLYKNNGEWELAVKTPEEEESTIFEMTSLREEEFVFINNEIDFPNKIKYWKSNDRIHAVISNPEV